MTPEQKAAIAAAAEAAKKGKNAEAEEANADEVAAEPIEGTEAAEADEHEPSQPDYEALLKAEKERADAAEKAAAELAFKSRDTRRKNKEETESEEENDDKPMTRAEARAFLAQQGQSLQKSAQEMAALGIARSNTATEAEAQAALLFYKTRVVPTGNLEDDVLFAIGGINRKRTVAKATELARALRSKETALHSTAIVHREGGSVNEPKLTAQDAQAIKQSGMAWDGRGRVYKKPLGNGAKHLFYDPKSKRRWVA